MGSRIVSNQERVQLRVLRQIAHVAAVGFEAAGDGADQGRTVRLFPMLRRR